MAGAADRVVVSASTGSSRASELSTGLALYSDNPVCFACLLRALSYDPDLNADRLYQEQDFAAAMRHFAKSEHRYGR